MDILFTIGCLFAAIICSIITLYSISLEAAEGDWGDIRGILLVVIFFMIFFTIYKFIAHVTMGFYSPKEFFSQYISLTFVDLAQNASATLDKLTHKM